MKTYIVEFDPLRGEADGFYVKMTDAQAKDLRGVFKALETEKVLREWRIEVVDEIANSYRDFLPYVENLMEQREKKPKDWFPGLRADRD